MAPLVSSSAQDTPTVTASSVEANSTAVVRTSTPLAPISANLAASRSFTLVSLPNTGSGRQPSSCSFAAMPARESASMTGVAATSSTAEPPLSATTFRYVPAASSGMTSAAASAPSSSRNGPSALSAAYHWTVTSSVTSSP